MPYWMQVMGVFAAVNGIMCAAYLLGRRLGR